MMAQVQSGKQDPENNTLEILLSVCDHGTWKDDSAKGGRSKDCLGP